MNDLSDFETFMTNPVVIPGSVNYEWESMVNPNNLFWLYENEKFLMSRKIEEYLFDYMQKSNEVSLKPVSNELETASIFPDYVSDPIVRSQHLSHIDRLLQCQMDLGRSSLLKTKYTYSLYNRLVIMQRTYYAVYSALRSTKLEAQMDSTLVSRTVPQQPMTPSQVIETGVRICLSSIFKLFRQTWSKPLAGNEDVCTEVLSTAVNVLCSLPPLSLYKTEIFSIVGLWSLQDIENFLYSIVTPSSHINKKARILGLQLLLLLGMHRGGAQYLIKWIRIALICCRQEKGMPISARVRLPNNFTTKILGTINGNDNDSTVDDESCDIPLYYATMSITLNVSNLAIKMANDSCSRSATYNSLPPQCSTFCWGWNSYGQCDIEVDANHLPPYNRIMPGITMLETGIRRTFVVSAGQVMSSYLASDSLTSTSEVFKLNAPVCRIICSKEGEGHSIIIDEKGTILTWGNGNHGKLGHGETALESTPSIVKGPLLGKVVVDASCRNNHSACVTTDGKVYTWGSGENGRLGHGDIYDRYLPTIVAHLAECCQVACGTSHTLSLSMDKRTIYSFGCGAKGALGIRNTYDQLQPVCVDRLCGVEIKKIAAGMDVSFALAETGQVFVWGSGVCLGMEVVSVPVPHLLEDLSSYQVDDISVGYNHVLALTVDSVIFSWGANSNAECGQFGMIIVRTPKRVSGMTDSSITSISAGSAHSFAWTTKSDNPSTRESVQQPYGIEMDEATFKEIFISLQDYYDYYSGEVELPFLSLKDQESFVCMMLDWINAHIRVASSCRMDLPTLQYANNYRHFLLRLIDFPVSEEVKSKIYKVLSSSLFLPTMEERLRIITNIIPESWKDWEEMPMSKKVELGIIMKSIKKECIDVELLSTLDIIWYTDEAEAKVAVKVASDDVPEINAESMLRLLSLVNMISKDDIFITKNRATFSQRKEQYPPITEYSLIMCKPYYVKRLLSVLQRNMIALCVRGCFDVPINTVMYFTSFLPACSAILKDTEEALITCPSCIADIEDILHRSVCGSILMEVIHSMLLLPKNKMTCYLSRLFGLLRDLNRVNRLVFEESIIDPDPEHRWLWLLDLENTCALLLGTLHEHVYVGYESRYSAWQEWMTSDLFTNGLKFPNRSIDDHRNSLRDFYLALQNGRICIEEYIKNNLMNCQTSPTLGEFFNAEEELMTWMSDKAIEEEWETRGESNEFLDLTTYALIIVFISMPGISRRLLGKHYCTAVDRASRLVYEVRAQLVSSSFENHTPSHWSSKEDEFSNGSFDDSSDVDSYAEEQFENACLRVIANCARLLFVIEPTTTLMEETSSDQTSHKNFNICLELLKEVRRYVVFHGDGNSDFGYENIKEEFQETSFFYTMFDQRSRAKSRRRSLEKMTELISPQNTQDRMIHSAYQQLLIGMFGYSTISPNNTDNICRPPGMHYLSGVDACGCILRTEIREVFHSMNRALILSLLTQIKSEKVTTLTLTIIFALTEHYDKTDLDMTLDYGLLDAVLWPMDPTTLWGNDVSRLPHLVSMAIDNLFQIMVILCSHHIDSLSDEVVQGVMKCVYYQTQKFAMGIFQIKGTGYVVDDCGQAVWFRESKFRRRFEQLLGNLLAFIRRFCSTDMLRRSAGKEEWACLLVDLAGSARAMGLPIVQSVSTELTILKLLSTVLPLVDLGTDSKQKVVHSLFRDLSSRMWEDPYTASKLRAIDIHCIRCEATRSKHFNVRFDKSTLSSCEIEFGNTIAHTVRKPGYGFLSFPIISGCYQWNFVIENLRQSCFVGVAKSPITDYACRSSKDFWLFQADLGHLYHGGRVDTQGPFIVSGDTITVVLNVECKTLSLGSRTTPVRIAFDDIEQTELYPCVFFDADIPGQRVRIDDMHRKLIQTNVDIGQPECAPHGAVLAESLVQLLRSLHSDEKWTQCVNDCLIKRLTESERCMITFAQKTDRVLDQVVVESLPSPTMHCTHDKQSAIAKLCSTVWPALAVIAGIDSGLKLGGDCRQESTGRMGVLVGIKYPVTKHNKLLRWYTSLENTKLLKADELEAVPMAGFDVSKLTGLTGGIVTQLMRLAGLTNEMPFPLIPEEEKGNNEEETNEETIDVPTILESDQSGCLTMDILSERLVSDIIHEVTKKDSLPHEDIPKNADKILKLEEYFLRLAFLKNDSLQTIKVLMDCPSFVHMLLIHKQSAKVRKQEAKENEKQHQYELSSALRNVIRNFVSVCAATPPPPETPKYNLERARTIVHHNAIEFISEVRFLKQNKNKIDRVNEKVWSYNLFGKKQENFYRPTSLLHSPKWNYDISVSSREQGLEPTYKELLNSSFWTVLEMRYPASQINIYIRENGLREKSNCLILDEMILWMESHPFKRYESHDWSYLRENRDYFTPIKYEHLMRHIPLSLQTYIIRERLSPQLDKTENSNGMANGIGTEELTPCSSTSEDQPPVQRSLRISACLLCEMPGTIPFKGKDTEATDGFSYALCSLCLTIIEETNRFLWVITDCVCTKGVDYKHLHYGIEEKFYLNNRHESKTITTHPINSDPSVTKFEQLCEKLGLNKKMPIPEPIGFQSLDCLGANWPAIRGKEETNHNLLSASLPLYDQFEEEDSLVHLAVTSRLPKQRASTLLKVTQTMRGSVSWSSVRSCLSLLQFAGDSCDMAATLKSLGLYDADQLIRLLWLTSHDNLAEQDNDRWFSHLISAISVVAINEWKEANLILQLCCKHLLCAAFGAPLEDISDFSSEDDTTTEEHDINGTWKLKRINGSSSFIVIQALVSLLTSDMAILRNLDEKKTGLTNSTCGEELVDALATCVLSAKALKRHRKWATKQLVIYFVNCQQTCSESGTSVAEKCWPTPSLSISIIETEHKNSTIVCLDYNKVLVMWNNLAQIFNIDVNLNLLLYQRSKEFLPDVEQKPSRSPSPTPAKTKYHVVALPSGYAAVAYNYFFEIWFDGEDQGSSVGCCMEEWITAIAAPSGTLDKVLCGQRNGKLSLVTTTENDCSEKNIMDLRRIPVTSVAWKNANHLAAAGFQDGYVIVFKAKRRRIHADCQLTKRPITNLSWNASGSMLFCINEDTFHVCVVSKDNKLATIELKTKSAICVTDWSPLLCNDISAKSILACGCEDGSIIVWEILEAEPRSTYGRRLGHPDRTTIMFEHQGHQEPITCLSFYPNGVFFATASGKDTNGVINIWSLEDGDLVQSIPFFDGISDMTWVVDKGIIVCLANSQCTSFIKFTDDHYQRMRIIHQVGKKLSQLKIGGYQNAIYLREFFVHLPGLIRSQYKIEAYSISRGKNLMHSLYLQNLCSIAMLFDIDKILFSNSRITGYISAGVVVGENWQWLHRLCVSIRTSESMLKRTTLPEGFMKWCHKYRSETETNIAADQSQWTAEMDADLMRWEALYPGDWKMAATTEVFMWGNGSYGEFGESGCVLPSPTHIEAMTYAQKVVCGAGCTFIVTISGSVYSCGNGSYGRLGHGDSDNIVAPTIVPALQGYNIIKIATSIGMEAYSLALTITGEVFSWGDGGNGQLGHGNAERQRRPRLIEALLGYSIVEVACGFKHSAVVTEDGKVFTFGSDEHGQLGHGDFADRKIPEVMTSLAAYRIGTVSCGMNHTACVSQDGNTVWTFGDSDYDRKRGTFINVRRFPRKVDGMNGLAIRKVCCGTHFTVFLSMDGKLYMCGYMKSGQHQTNARPIVGLEDKVVVDISVGGEHTLAVTDVGVVYGWGPNSAGQLGLGHSFCLPKPTRISALDSRGITQISAGAGHCAAWNAPVRVYGTPKQPTSIVFTAPRRIPPQFLLFQDKKPVDLAERLGLLFTYSDVLYSTWQLLPLTSFSGIGPLSAVTSLPVRSLLSHKAQSLPMDNWLTRTMVMGKYCGPTITVNRLMSAKSIFLQISSQVLKLKPAELRLPSRAWKVRLVGEGADDAGGVFDELLTEICHEIISDRVNLLIGTPNKLSNVGNNRDKFLLNPEFKSELQLSWFKFLGIIFGVAIRTKKPLSLPIAPLVWKLILGVNPTVADLQEVDTEYINSLLSIGDTKSEEITEENFHEVIPLETFECTSWTGERVPVVPGGRSVPLKFNNRVTYVTETFKYRMKEMNLQVAAIREGMAWIIPVPLLHLMTPQHLEELVCGMPRISTAALKKIIRYKGLPDRQDMVTWFWSILESFTNSERTLFIRFISGRSRLPANLDDLSQKIYVMVIDRPMDGLPTAQTCFLQLRLPPYSCQAVMASKLRYAINSCRSIDNDDYMLHLENAAVPWEHE